MIKPILVVTVALWAASVFAQQPAATPQPADTATAKPKHNCVKPVYPGHLAMDSASRTKSFNREVTTYKECMQKFANDQNEIVKAAIAAANAAVDEYNQYIKDLNKAAGNEESSEPGKPATGSPGKGY
jgi:hypothetical protein